MGWGREGGEEGGKQVREEGSRGEGVEGEGGREGYTLSAA